MIRSEFSRAIASVSRSKRMRASDFWHGKDARVQANITVEFRISRAKDEPHAAAGQILRDEVLSNAADEFACWRRVKERFDFF